MVVNWSSTYSFSVLGGVSVTWSQLPSWFFWTHPVDLPVLCSTNTISHYLPPCIPSCVANCKISKLLGCAFPSPPLKNQYKASIVYFWFYTKALTFCGVEMLVIVLFLISFLKHYFINTHVHDLTCSPFWKVSLWNQKDASSHYSISSPVLGEAAPTCQHLPKRHSLKCFFTLICLISQLYLQIIIETKSPFARI